MADGIFTEVVRQLEDGTHQPSGTRPDEGGVALLDDVHAFLKRLIVCSDAALVAGALWTVHTHAFDAADVTPRLSIRSAEAESGKTRWLESLKLIVRAPRFSIGISDAALFRVVESEQPTVLHDEIDTLFGPKARDREDLRGMLNAGYERGATVPRCVGEGSKMKVNEFKVFTPVALAGLGKLPYTLETRSIVIHMKPRTANEPVSRLRRRKIKPEADALRARLEAWAKDHVAELIGAEPNLPDELSDRAQDIWEPLIAIADAVGGGWPERARAAAAELFASRGDDEESIGRRLLSDIRAVFDDPARDDPVDEIKGQAIRSGALAAALAAIEGAPWAEWTKDDKPISATKVARMLKPFGVGPDQHKVAGKNIRGYLRSDFEDTWERHLPVPGESVTDAKLLPPNPNKGKGGNTSSPVTLHPGRGQESGGWAPPGVGYLAQAALPLDPALENYNPKLAQVEQTAREPLANPEQQLLGSLGALEVKVDHPARFSLELLPAIARVLTDWRLPVHDCFAGTGERLGRLCDETGLVFTGTEIEPEWIVDARVRQGDSTDAATYPTGEYVIATSPTYPNGMADHFRARDDSRRHTYRQALQRTRDGADRPLHENNTGRYNIRRGEQIEAQYWTLVRAAVFHWPDRAVVNVKDFYYENTKIYPLVAKWITLLEKYDYEIVDRIDVETPGQRHGANRQRVETEAVLVAQRPEADR